MSEQPYPETTLGQCPEGLFLFDGTLGFKSKYRTESLSSPGVWQSDAYVVESGEYFWGGVLDTAEREALMVTPLDPVHCAKCHEIVLRPATDAGSQDTAEEDR